MIFLTDVYEHDESCKILYDLLSERTPEQSISHRKMPTWDEHVEFFNSRPYKEWYLIQNKRIEYEPECSVIEQVGSCYLTKQNEIGIFIFNKHQGNGYGKASVKELMTRNDGPFLANINPRNFVSQGMFESLGFERIQETFKYG